MPSTADPALKAKVYAEFGVEVIYHPGQAQALVSARVVPSVSEDSTAQTHTVHCRRVA